MKTLLKRISLILVMSGIALAASAQGIVVNKKDGTKVYYKASEVLSVSVYGYDEEPEPEHQREDSLNIPEYVDLGLPSGTLWATMNLGASSPEDYGDYFAWGEIKGYKNGRSFTWSAYKWYDSYKLTKYCTVKWQGKLDNKTVLESADDAAKVNRGLEWSMPSRAQFSELINSNYTTAEWTTLNGVYGYKVTSKSNSNSIFLPAAGGFTPSLVNVGKYGFYWSNTLCIGGETSEFSYILWLEESGIRTDDELRSRGLSVRPVRVQK